MRPTTTLARETTRDGAEMILYEHDGVYTLRVDGYELMSSRAHGSEDELARLPCELIATRRAPRVLVCGLGFGFTLRSALTHLPADAVVTVCEVFPHLVKWNRGILGELAGYPLRDRRVEVVEADVGSYLDRCGVFDAILLDVDNGPEAFTLRSNERLYDPRGVARLRDRLPPGGVLCVWSATPSKSFERRLQKAGFRTETRKVAARTGGKGPAHYLFLATAGKKTRPSG